MSEFFGKYRGRVENNLDPLVLGRMQVSVPDVLGNTRLAWAIPCVPYAGEGVGLFAMPPVGAHIWVEFEAGDPERPIWVGCFWCQGQVPATPAAPTTKVFKTEFVALTILDTPGGGLTLEVEPPASTTPLKLTMNAEGIEIANTTSTIKITPASVSINNGALEILGG